MGVSIHGRTIMRSSISNLPCDYSKPGGSFGQSCDRLSFWIVVWELLFYQLDKVLIYSEFRLSRD